MLLDVALARRCLKDSDFNCLFIEGLGWDRYTSHLDVTVDDRTHSLSAVAQKRGMVAFVWQPPSGGRIPDYPTRRKVERKVAKSVHEHLIVYVDSARTTQVWQWVKRQAGRPAACREHTYHTSQTGEPLIQRLQAIAVSLEEEEGLTLVDVTSRVRAGFDVEKVTKRFYDYFKTEHAAFTKFLRGIPDEGLERWYVSVMLNRLMFIYFIQKKGFLDGDPDYLRNKLAASRDRGKDRYYRDLLCPLFFEGFAKRPQDRSAATNRLLGQVPYLNGGLFLKHQIEEQHGRTIEIPDKAFEKIFAFFDAYRWHLDERPLRRDDEINPDVLGYIFEKYINAIQPGEQKAKGAYYSKEDITGYISQNTVIPRLFDMARAKCKVAFDLPAEASAKAGGGAPVWRLLAADPDRYIYEPVRRGVIAEDGSIVPEPVLPDFVQKGMHDPKARMFNKKYNLGQAHIPPLPTAGEGGVRGEADGPNLALPTETWREYVERRKRCLDLRRKIAAGEVHEINDLITLNLDIRQFAQDVVENAEGPDLLVAFWNAIQGITVLDPACGSGAFLFAALNILEPLYEACLDRMTAFLDEWGEAGRKRHPNYHKLFTETLARVAEHPSRRYFILKSIVIQNLYGVDIMDEAVEICKLRLFLKLVAQVDDPDRIEPLPDIDFNIRSGNTLVGFAAREAVKEAISKEQAGKFKQDKFVFGDEAEALKKIEEKAGDVDRLFIRFREQQTQYGGTVTATDKDALRKRLWGLEDELNRYLAAEYAVEPSKPAEYQRWLDSHRSFHWFVDFYGIMKRGGFDVVIGNPPYVEYKDVWSTYRVRNFRTEGCGNLFAYFVERCATLGHTATRVGVIIPLSAFSTDRMTPLIQHLKGTSSSLRIGNFGWRPGKLFDGVNLQLSILMQEIGQPPANIESTRYLLWDSQGRSELFDKIEFAPASDERLPGSIPKLGCSLGASILGKLRSRKSEMGICFTSRSPNKVFYRRGGLYWKVFVDFETGSSEEKILPLRSDINKNAIIAALSSNLWFWYFTVTSDCRHLGNRDIYTFPLDLGEMASLLHREMCDIGKKYIGDLRCHAENRVRVYKGRKAVQCLSFRVNQSKPIIDEIDRVLARHYGFTDEELDFIINYDIKYRMGGGEDDGDDE